MLALTVTFLGSGTIVGFLEHAAYSRLQDDYKSQIEQTVQVNAVALARFVDYNPSTIGPLLEAMLRQRDVVAAVMRGPSGAPLAWARRDADGRPIWGKGEWPEEFAPRGPRIATEPIVYGELGVPEIVGELEGHFTDQRLADHLQDRLLAAVGMMAVLLASVAVGVQLGWWLFVSRPLGRWREAVEESSAEKPVRLQWPAGGEIGMLADIYNRTIDGQHATVDDLGRRLGLFEAATEGLDHGFCIFDRDFRLQAYNRRYAELLDYKDGFLHLGMSLSDILRHNADRGEYGSANVDAVIIDRLAIASSQQKYLRERERPNGQILEVESTPLPDGGFVSLYRDVSQQKVLEVQARNLALNDATTGLPNRSLFHDRLRQALALSDRTGQRLALVLVDLDGFRQIVESVDAETVDAVLRETSERVSQIARKSDTTARLDEDCFALVQQHVEHVDDAALIAHRLLGAISRPFEVAETSLHLTASIGITLYPDDDKNSRNLLKNAYLALATAKAEGRNRFRYFAPETNQAVARRRRLEEEIFRGLRRDEFVLHYQPRMELTSGRLAGVEALVRWRHPERGLLLPSEFLPLAEDRGLAVPLCEWMLETACQQRFDWQQHQQTTSRDGRKGEANGAQSWRISVNLSGRCFSESDVLESVSQVLTRVHLDHHLLEVEVDAQDMFRDHDTLSEGLRALRAMGIAATMDGFGDGASSFTTIRSLPIDGIKIDCHLVRDLEHDIEAGAIVKAVIGLGRKLSLRVVADGVEEPRLLEQLQAEGCPQAQGRIFSQPLTGQEFGRWASDYARRSRKTRKPKQPKGG